MAGGLDHPPPGGRRLIVVVGGTGFLGRRVVRHLLQRGFTVRAASRHPERLQHLFASGQSALQAVAADVAEESSLPAALVGAYGAVNAVSLYTERVGATFHAVHHLSGIGADPTSSSPYIRARGEGEQSVRRTFPMPS